MFTMYSFTKLIAILAILFNTTSTQKLDRQKYFIPNEFSPNGALASQSCSFVMSHTKASHLLPIFSLLTCSLLTYSGCCFTNSTAVSEKSQAYTRVFGWVLTSRIGNTVFPTPQPT